MAPRRVSRTPEEEAEFQRLRRERRAANARISRSRNSNRVPIIVPFTESVTIHRIPENVIEENYLGPMNELCIHCNAKHFKGEKIANKPHSYNQCCSHGEVKLDPLPEFPVELRNLLNGTHEKSKEFFPRIRVYNNSFSFASFNANLYNFRSTRSAPYCFKIQGQIYYQVNTSLYSDNNENPSYGQLFIVDSHEAVDYRMQKNVDLDEDILKSLDLFYRQNNVYAQSFEMMHREVKIQQQLN